MERNAEYLDYGPDLRAALAAGYIATEEELKSATRPLTPQEAEEEGREIVEGQPWGD